MRVQRSLSARQPLLGPPDHGCRCRSAQTCRRRVHLITHDDAVLADLRGEVLWELLSDGQAQPLPVVLEESTKGETVAKATFALEKRCQGLPVSGIPHLEANVGHWFQCLTN